ncbi:hypothetical protein DH09_19255 [Bacillaceae bacterium JMAK1]|nr:hypothetical protein DH09_19255 [Bacillaceae bacterium JMAK1]
MKAKKNKVMLFFTGFFIGILFIVMFLHRGIGWLDRYLILTGRVGNGDFTLVITFLLILPVVFFIVAVLYYTRSKEHALIEWFVMLSLTFGSIALIAIGDGLIEYHFSIFMVLAALAYYEHMRLLIVSTVIFALQHFVGYFAFPELICGTGDYPFSLLMIHAVFLLVTSGVLLTQIRVRSQYIADVQETDDRQQKLIKSLVERVAKTSDIVTSNVEKLDNSSKRSTEASLKNRESFSQMEAGALIQVENAVLSQSALKNVEDLVSQIVQTGKESESIAREASHSATAGSTYMSDSMMHMAGIASHMNHMYEQMTSLNEKMREIEKVTEFITTIGEQTNLLALNASIEAARAGKEGKGFSVVAKEMRRLSEQSSENARIIVKVISQIQAETSKLNERIAKAQKDSKSGLNQSEQTKQRFESIALKVEGVHERLLQSFHHTSTIHAEMEKALENVESMTSVTEQYRQTINESAAVSEKDRNDRLIMNQSIHDLKQLILNLHDDLGELRAQEL